MLPRTLEPEVMDSEEEATDYDAMDHGGVNAAFADDVAAARPDARTVLDVGTGTALIPVLLCRRLADARVLAIDLADSMLAVARENVARAGLEARVRLERRDAKNLALAGAAFDVVMSNSLVHHLPAPGAALAEMWRATSEAGGVLFVRDLVRPASEEAVRDLVARHSPPAPPAHEVEKHAQWDRQTATFAASLRAALTIDEVRALVAPLGVEPSCVGLTSDRHWTLVARRTSRGGAAP